MPGTQVIPERSTLRVRLLGALALERDGQPLRLPRHKVESLLAYLLLHPQSHTREKLATLCWGDVPDAQARHSLRTAGDVDPCAYPWRSALGDRARR